MAASDGKELSVVPEAAMRSPQDVVKPAVELGSLRALLLPFYIPVFGMHLAKSLVVVVLPMEVLALGYSYNEVGILGAIMGVGTVFGNIPAGKIVAATGPRQGMIVACVGHALAAAMATLATFLPASDLRLLPLALAFLLVGLADTTAVLARMTMLGATVPAEMRGQAGSALGGALRFGISVGPFIAGFVAQAAESRAVFLLMGAMSIANVFVVLRFVPNISSTQEIAKNKPDKKAVVVAESKLEVVRKPSMAGVFVKHWRVILIVTVFSACFAFVKKARELFFSLEGHTQELAPNDIGKITSLSFAIDGMLFPVAGKMLDGLGRRPTGAISTFGLCLAFLALVAGKYGDDYALPAFIFYAVFSGLASGLSGGILQVMVADLAPPSARSEFIAVFRMLTRTADIMAPMLIGVLAAVSTLEVAEIVAAFVSLIATLWAVFFIKETLKRKPMPLIVDSSKMLPEKVGKYEDLEDAGALAEVNAGRNEKE